MYNNDENTVYRHNQYSDDSSDEEMDSFSHKISTLKNFSVDLKHIVNRQNQEIRQLGQATDRNSGYVRNTLRRLYNTDKYVFSTWFYYLAAFFLLFIVFFILYVVF